MGNVRQILSDASYTKFYENLSNNLVPDTRVDMTYP
jgi:hypothetical protein